jgi:hypothetical protein
MKIEVRDLTGGPGVFRGVETMKWFIGIVLLLCGCTDTYVASISAIGSAGQVVCYSGGKEILNTWSTGKIQTTANSDGWEFKDAATGKFTRVSGDCVVRN